VTIERLVNGRSIFGGPGSQRPIAVPIGSHVVDDAHAAVATTEAQSTVTIPREHPAYDRLLAMFRNDLQRQSDMALRDIEAADPPALITVPFWAWSDHAADVGAVLHEHRDDEPLRFTYPMLADILPICIAVVTAGAIEIRPPCPQITAITGFAVARRRIYLSATLPDDSVLVSHFDATPERLPRDHAPKRRRSRRPDDPCTPRDQPVNQPGRGAPGSPTVRQPPQRRRPGRESTSSGALGERRRRNGGCRRHCRRGGAVECGPPRIGRSINKYDGIDLPGAACQILVSMGAPRRIAPWIDARPFC
jgi:hypothetical protein